MTTPLSAHEQKVLAELELQLFDVDPSPVETSAVDSSEAQAEKIGPEQRRRYWSRRQPVTGALAGLAGAVLLAVGVSLPNLAVGAAGFVMMGAGVYLATLPAGSLCRKRTTAPAGSRTANETPAAGKAPDAGQKSAGGRLREAVWWSLLFWL
jgi:hypothetical protein